jgi:hypothetical protein
MLKLKQNVIELKKTFVNRLLYWQSLALRKFLSAQSIKLLRTTLLKNLSLSFN